MKTQYGPLGKAWTDIGSDVNWQDYGGCWARHIDGTRYHVIRFENCREWGDDATGYHCQLMEVDVTNPQLERAFACNGLDIEEMNERQDPGKEWSKVSALEGYGAAAPLWQESGTRVRELIRAAKRESRLLATDSDEYEDRMDQPVNAIGTSARNYGLGKILASD